jgi:pSer/pThr/pTyr-binding forkhead associated (FHA) protein
MALSSLVDDEGAFYGAFPQAVVLLSLPPEVRPRWAPGTPKGRTSALETDVHRPASPPRRSIEEYHEAAVVKLLTPSTTVGRAATSAVLVPLRTVSNNHGQLSVSGSGRWVYADAGSTNGSWHRGKIAPPHQPVDLENGTEIVLGWEVSLMFLEPAGLLRLARLVRSQVRGED